MLYRARGRGLPTLLKISRGPYDWVQGLAVDKLAWLASEGVQTEFVAQELVAMLAQWRYETVLRAMPGLAALAGRSPQFGETLLQLADEWAREDPVEALEILGPLAEQAPTLAKERQSLLRQIMAEHGQGLPRGPPADGQVVVEGNQLVAVGGRQYPPINHLHAIRAALTLRSLDPGDAEVAACLEQWMEHHPDPGLRSELKQRLTD